VFGCWTSVSANPVLPVFKELTSILFYSVQYEGEEERAQRVLHRRRAQPAGDTRRHYLMRTRGAALGAGRPDYVYRAPPTRSSKLLQSKGVKDEDIPSTTRRSAMPTADPRRAIKALRSGGKKTAVVSTINGDANVPFYKELGNQGSRPRHPGRRVLGREEELAGVDTKPLLGHLAAWNYFQSIDTPINKNSSPSGRLHQEREARQQ